MTDTTDGKVALFSGDVFHHPVELHLPDLVSIFCEFPDATRRSRRLFMKRAVETRAIVFSSHFPRSSVGRVLRDGEEYAWKFDRSISD